MCKVLVVDDHHDTTESMRVLLELKGHEAQTANDAETAITLAEEFKPKVVLLDIGLPEHSGYVVGQIIKAKDSEVIIIVITGFGNEEFKNKSREAGFDEFFIKPIEPEILEKILDKYKFC